MKYKHIIWDFNGTLLDDVNQCVSVVDGMMARRRLGQLTVERYHREVDFPIIDFYVKLGFNFDKESYKDVAHEYMAQYLEHIKNCRLQNDALEVLDELTAAGYSHSVLSAYHQQRLEEAIDYFHLRKRFIKIIGMDDYYAHGKLQRGVDWINQLHIARDKVLFVGDMLHDFEVAEAMKVDCVLLSCGHQGRNQLESCGVEVFDSIREFYNWVVG